MSQAHYPIVFVTGTDTEVGKTVVSCTLLAALNNHGCLADGFKPVASGATYQDGMWTNEDGLALQKYSGRSLPYDWVNPNTYEPAIAPHIAAVQAGSPIETARLDQQLARLREGAELVLIEGAGGWQVPLNEHARFCDWVSGHSWPVIVVVGIRLGCINHALLTIESIAHRGCEVVGWVANHVQPKTEVLAANVAYLKANIEAPLLGLIDYQKATLDPAGLATELNVTSLL
ncbi:dethiobiotin synthase [Celerinatantimonas diazotrophica]|uniref:ATP-dependent dethiobiotin synthetase BioD n=1 Tax=Celerinatantimonas diazotrophica TaxID=412034 RepID=A0A4R1K105_9GAMM|nr:dethiobiotin synthase [Celerinatantimonas diazotrophica]TCK57622.1 dethiobiotin synthase [Celerinatantimonas diazotrophica]CAG9298316.1 ATP-dependent dethiobiotin synthetase BioD 1 [Celerinatantimonas diazotrophica]